MYEGCNMIPVAARYTCTNMYILGIIIDNITTKLGPEPDLPYRHHELPSTYIMSSQYYPLNVT